MTESEAIKWLREMQNPLISEAELYCAETCYGTGKMVYPEPEDYVFETAIQALEKVQQFEAIGTIERFRELTEKAEPKKVVRPKGELNQYYHEEKCPNCKAEFRVHIAGYRFEQVVGKTHHCPNCGQRLDWE